jgi:hypothetical protein
MARLYANENFPLPVVELSREAGHEVLTSTDAGNAGRAIPDKEVLDFASEQNRAVLTFNRRHFVRLHTTQPQHSGIVVCTFDLDFRALAERIHAALANVKDIRGQLFRVNREHR